MSNYKYQQDDKVLGLQEMTVTDAFEWHSKEDLTKLEYDMATSSIGYEYALLELEEELDQNGIHATRIKEEIENLREQYFEARDKFFNLDSKRLVEFERSLTKQKEEMFPRKGYLH